MTFNYILPLIVTGKWAVRVLAGCSYSFIERPDPIISIYFGRTLQYVETHRFSKVYLGHTDDFGHISKF